MAGDETPNDSSVVTTTGPSPQRELGEGQVTQHPLSNDHHIPSQEIPPPKRPATQATEDSEPHESMLPTLRQARSHSTVSTESKTGSTNELPQQSISRSQETVSQQRRRQPQQPRPRHSLPRQNP